MAKYTDPMALLRHQATLFDAVSRKRNAMFAAFVRERADEQLTMLSGSISEQELRNMGHPFARRKVSRRGYERTSAAQYRKGYRMSEQRRTGFAASAPLLPINRQSGGLYRSQQIRFVRGQMYSQQATVGYGASYARYILGPKGTSRMVNRGFVQWRRKADDRAKKRLIHDINAMQLRAAVQGRVI